MTVIEVDASSGLSPKEDYSVAKHAKIASDPGACLSLLRLLIQCGPS